MTRQIYSKWNINRQHFKWNINELIRLEREYDLLELNIKEIAILHQRTAYAIAMKLQSEGIISNYTVARGYIKSASDSDCNSKTNNYLIDDNKDSDSSSEYIPSDSDSDSDSDYDSDYDSDSDSEKYKFKSFAKKYHQYKNNDTQTVFDSGADFGKNSVICHVINSDSDSDSSVEIIENNNVTQRVDKLETSVSNMEGMLTKVYQFMTSGSSSFAMGYNE